MKVKFPSTQPIYDLEKLLTVTTADSEHPQIKLVPTALTVGNTVSTNEVVPHTLTKGQRVNAWKKLHRKQVRIELSFDEFERLETYVKSKGISRSQAIKQAFFIVTLLK